MAQLAINASPFHCRWVLTGSELQLEQWTYAICLRERNHMRVVSEDECSRCACWEQPTDVATRLTITMSVRGSARLIEGRKRWLQ